MTPFQCVCKRAELSVLNCRALFSSIAPALLRQASYGTVKIGLYHYLKKINPAGMTIHTLECTCVPKGMLGSWPISDEIQIHHIKGVFQLVCHSLYRSRSKACDFIHQRKLAWKLSCQVFYHCLGVCVHVFFTMHSCALHMSIFCMLHFTCHPIIPTTPKSGHLQNPN